VGAARRVVARRRAAEPGAQGQALQPVLDAGAHRADPLAHALADPAGQRAGPRGGLARGLAHHAGGLPHVTGDAARARGRVRALGVGAPTRAAAGLLLRGMARSGAGLAARRPPCVAAARRTRRRLLSAVPAAAFALAAPLASVAHRVALPCDW
jgi:hypothetical protein